jgi:hypothetical protein
MDRIQHSIKQVIDGKTYNTETAECLTESYGTGVGTHLYKTKNGNFFVGHSTIWENSHSFIEPINKESAMEQFGNGMSPEDYENAFGVKPEEA